MSDKVGIVIVSYNASLAVRITLASLRAAGNTTPSEVVLVDNASSDVEQNRIHRAFARHAAATGTSWLYLPQQKNLGFSGGNNVGIRHFLQDPSITHICLLNSDVIVPEAWLDRLLAAGRDVVSGVTNKAESEQCVPVDYTLTMEACLDEGSETLRDGVFEEVDRFAQRWHRAWQGNVVECDATFFCVLLSRAAVERIGLLDETFFPGGYEDDDYCARARACGIGVHLARDVFIHHWGSASFGKLNYEYFRDNANRNRSYLEQKHGFTWRKRPEKPFVAFAQDVAFAMTGAGDRGLQSEFCSLYEQALGQLVGHYCSEFANLRQAIQRVAGELPEEVREGADRAASQGDLARQWQGLCSAIVGSVRRPGSRTRHSGELLGQLQAFADAVHALVCSTLAMHEFTRARGQQQGAAGAIEPLSWWRRCLALVRHGVPFLFRLRGIVFFAGYPYAAREKDGYFQRIRVIDAMFEDRWRIYFDPDPLPGQWRWYDLPAPRTLVLRPLGGRLRRVLVAVLVRLCALRCRNIYFHSVLRMQDLGFGALMKWPWLRKVLDVHGVVPEEFRMHEDYYSAVLFEAHEKVAVQRACGVIVVTEAMRRYFAQKYRDRLRGEVVVMPIFPAMACDRAAKPIVDGRPVVVYAGGLHKWQQVPKMVDTILRTRGFCRHRFYCPKPELFVAMLPAELVGDGSLVIESKTHEELVDAYRECHYGLLLREDSVVNHVACPTKLVEYLAMGIVPILDCERIGDFTDLGMRFVRLADFVAGKLPDPATREAMVAENFVVHGRLRGQREAGAARLRQLLGPGLVSGGFASRLLWETAKLLPPSTRRGRFARWLWNKLHRRPPATAPAGAAVAADLAPCDVLVQVGNFLAGGLENSVLDINEALRAAGFRVSMLVLGEQGSAVERARAQGVPVCAARYSDEAYRRWLQAAAPKVVMSHYSVDGAAICGELGVPLVQVIQNIYLWLDAQQSAAMRASAAHTTTFVAASAFARDYSIARLGFPAEKCVVIPYGIDVKKFRAAAAGPDRERLRASLGIGADEFVFLNVGAVNHQKNHMSQLRAFKECAAACPDVRLVVIGPVYEQELLQDCRRFVERHGLADRVTFAAGVSDSQRYYAMADALVHSAFFEGGPLTLLEALAANLPIVTVATGLAVHFVGCRGVAVVPAHFDVLTYHGHITEMKSSPETERQMAAAMVRMRRTRERPDLPPAIVDSFDRANAYVKYVELVHGLVAGGTAFRSPPVRSWPDALAERAG